jgi:hypothetical protein
MRNGLLVLGSFGAIVLVVFGIVSVKWYMWDIVIGQAGDSDRSMLFWGLPILIIGMFALIAAAVLAFTVVRSSRSGR